VRLSTGIFIPAPPREPYLRDWAREENLTAAALPSAQAPRLLQSWRPFLPSQRDSRRSRYAEAPDEDTAHDAAIKHLKAHASQHKSGGRKTYLTVWSKRGIDTPAIVDVTA